MGYDSKYTGAEIEEMLDTAIICATVSETEYNDFFDEINE